MWPSTGCLFCLFTILHKCMMNKGIRKLSKTMFASLENYLHWYSWQLFSEGIFQFSHSCFCFVFCISMFRVFVFLWFCIFLFCILDELNSLIDHCPGLLCSAVVSGQKSYLGADIINTRKCHHVTKISC